MTVLLIISAVVYVAGWAFFRGALSEVFHDANALGETEPPSTIELGRRCCLRPHLAVTPAGGPRRVLARESWTRPPGTTAALMAADIKVVQVPPRSIVLLRGLAIDDQLPRLVEAFTETLGHRDFVILHARSGDGDIEVWGPDVDLKAKVRELLGR